jgi:UDP-N-acetylmuramyl tripeptide synthase
MLTFTSPQLAALWLKERVQGALHADSRPVGAGDGFIAWPGAATDGRKHVAAALAQGAAACLVEHEGVDAFGFDRGVQRPHRELPRPQGRHRPDRLGLLRQPLGRCSKCWP